MPKFIKLTELVIMKICLAYPLYLPYVGGIELYINELAICLASNGQEVCIFTSKLKAELLKTDLKLQFTGDGGKPKVNYRIIFTFAALTPVIIYHSER